MTSRRPIQKVRLDFRLRADHKALIEQAAAVQGQTVTDFGIANLVKAAHETIQQATLTQLSARDRDVFLQMLDTDTEPNAALKAAAERYKARRG
jgi:uncharacterized protein (DUF1778 family)